MNATYTNGRISTRRRTTDGEDDGRIIVLALIADKGNEAKTNKLRSHLCSFFTTDDGGKIAEPLEGGEGGKAVAMSHQLRLSGTRRLAICHVHDLDTLGPFVVSGCGIEGLCRLWGIVGLAADETTEEGGDDGLGDDNLVIDGATFEMKELHAYGLCRKDMGQMVAVDAIATDETFKDVETLGGENVDATVLEKIGGGISCVFDETSVHEML
jgi:hypothetical protein